MKHIKTIIKLLLSNSFWFSFAIIMGLKLLYLILFQPTIEIDSWGYVACILNFSYPPYYGYFLYVLYNLLPNVYFACVVQIVIFSGAAALFSNYLNKKVKHIVWFSILIGLEPATSYYCSTLMSEALFIPMLLIWTIIIHYIFSKKETNFSDYILIGIVGGLLYDVRYAGLIITVVPFVLILIFKEHRSRFLLKYLLIIVGFQLALLPVRYKFKENFDTYQFNGFTGPVLWNNASAIYLFSDVRKNPKNDFEKFLITIPSSYFTANLALDARQLWEDSLPMKQFYKKSNVRFADTPKLNGMMMETAWHVVSDQPLRYITHYIIPNFTKIFKEKNYMYAAKYEAYFLQKYNYPIVPKLIIHKYLFGIYLTILILLTTFHLYYQRMDKFIIINLILSWFYLFFLTFFSVLDSRLYLILAINIIAMVNPNYSYNPG